MTEFGIICKQYRIEVPDMKIDSKDLKGLDLKLNSILDEYKASRGINFAPNPENKIPNMPSPRNLRTVNDPIPKLQTKTEQKHGKKIPQAIR